MSKDTMMVEDQLLNLMERIDNEGVWVENKRTGDPCKTVLFEVFQYPAGVFPLPTTRFVPWMASIKEIIGYIRGYNSAADFRAMNVNTWNANANENKAWLNNPHRKGEDDMGQAYRFRPIGYVPMIHRKETDSDEVKAGYEGTEFDMVRHCYETLLKGEDDRGLICNAWKPETFPKACLRPCLYQWHFKLLGGELEFTGTQRSVDTLLGLHFNMPQVSFMRDIFAHITGNKPGRAIHVMENVHIYESQFPVYKAHKQNERLPFTPPKLIISDKIKTLEDLESFDMDKFGEYFQLEGYEHHSRIDYPFTV